MAIYQFYKIKSELSEKFEKGLRKLSFSCKGYPDIHFFLWLNDKDELRQFQLIYNEKFIDWSSAHPFIFGVTNRRIDPESDQGTYKGVRTLHSNDDSSILEEAVKIVKDSDLPKYIGGLILEKIHEEATNRVKGSV